MLQTKCLQTSLALMLFALLASGCSKGSSSSSDTSSSSGSGSGGTTSTLLTTSNLDEVWTSSCFSGTDPITSATSYQLTLDMTSGGSFTYSTIWYTGTCTPSNYAIDYSSYGTYSIGSLSNGLQPLTFTVTSSDMMSFTTSAQSSINTNCGGTSPYISGANANYDGVHESTYQMLCQSLTFPSASNTTVNNVGYMSGSTLYLGASYDGIPGVFSTGTTPTSATVSFTY